VESGWSIWERRTSKSSHDLYRNRKGGVNTLASVERYIDRYKGR
jgi:hypothetical protein